MSNNITFEDFLESWKEDIIYGNPTTVELGRRFSQKIVTDWLDSPDTGMEIFYCDGAGDGGIDLAILNTGPEDKNTQQSGHTWYLVQSKYGSAFQGSNTLLTEAKKLIDTIDGQRKHLNSLSEDLVERITNFRLCASDDDKIILVFATERPLSEGERCTLEDIRILGKHKIGSLFDVESISTENIYKRVEEDKIKPEISISLKTNIVPTGTDLFVGSTKLLDLYQFLKDYRKETGDLDKIYDKNVRRFLGGRRKVNKGMQETLKKNPERFGLYNNGITIVVSDWESQKDKIILNDPHIVNGCQTSKTIWEVFDKYYGSGGNGVNETIEEWKEQSKDASVVTKIVKVGSFGENLLKEITRFTNSQNAVQEKDFLALSKDFSDWQKEMANRYDIYLEIQRGGWDSQKALQRRNISVRRFDKHVNASDLIKVYGAGWMEAAGLAFGKNPPFLPGGIIFEQIVAEPNNNNEGFGVEDLYAAYLLELAADEQKFGRGGTLARRQTRFLFYYITIKLMKFILAKLELQKDNKNTSRCLIKVLKNPDTCEILINSSVEIIDEYMSRDIDENVFQEPLLMERFNSDLNAFLKIDNLGKADVTPNLYDRIRMAERTLTMKSSGKRAIDTFVPLLLN